MQNVTKITLRNGATILIEPKTESISEQFEPGVSTTGALDTLKEKAVSQVTEISGDIMEKISNTIVAFSEQLLEGFDTNQDGTKPKSVTIEYGLNIVGGLDLQLANASAQGNIKVTVLWNVS